MKEMYKFVNGMLVVYVHAVAAIVCALVIAYGLTWSDSFLEIAEIIAVSNITLMLMSVCTQLYCNYKLNKIEKSKKEDEA